MAAVFAAPNGSVAVRTFLSTANRPTRNRQRLSTTMAHRAIVDEPFPLVQVFAQPYTTDVFSRVLTAGDFLKQVEQTKVVSTVTVQDLVMRDLDLRGVRLEWVAFSGIHADGCKFDHSVFTTCFMDFAEFERCSFNETVGSDCVFAGSTFRACTFVGATLDRCNFNGIIAEDCDFSDASLQHSRFIHSTLRAVQFVNCDLKQTLYHYAVREDLSFRYSNYEEAHF